MPSQVEGGSQTSFPNTRERGVLWFRTKEGTKTNEDLGRNDEVRTPLKEKAIHDKHRVNYGYRPIHLELRNRVFDVNHKRFMTVLGLLTRIHGSTRLLSQGQYG